MKKRKWSRRDLIRIREGAAKLLFPPCCPICDRVLPFSGPLICADCEKKLPWVRDAVCFCCGRPVGEREEYCEDCRTSPRAFDCGRAAFLYTNALRHSIYRMKKENRRDYLAFYAEAMVRAGASYLELWQPDVLAPIPMHPKKLARRGFNQSELLALRISRMTGIPCEKDLLKCVRLVPEQKGLGRKERQRNLAGCFAVREQGAVPRSVLLIDDIFTTGSTLEEASAVLRQAGARKICFLVLCTGQGKNPLHAPKTVLY